MSSSDFPIIRRPDARGLSRAGADLARTQGVKRAEYRIGRKIGLPRGLQFRNRLVMLMQSSFRKGLLLAATILGFLGCLVAQGSLPSHPVTGKLSVPDGKAAISSEATRSADQISEVSLANSDCKLTSEVEVGLADDDVVFEEDSMELSLLDIRQRTFRIDRGTAGSRFAAGAVRDIRLDISLPLLV